MTLRSTLLGSAAACLALAAEAADEPVAIGLLLGFTGPVESLVVDMARSAELAAEEISRAGGVLGGRPVVLRHGDSTCIDAGAATAAAERLRATEGVAAIIGAACSGATMAVARAVAIPHGMAMISPSATSPALSELEDGGLFFRVAPSDARQGAVLAGIVHRRGIRRIAVTYTNNDYGKGLAESFGRAFRALGGEIAAVASHEDGKADYTAEVGALSASGAGTLLVIGYVDQGGSRILRTALDLGAFDRFVLPDGMIGDVLLDRMGAELAGSFGTMPGAETDGSARFAEMAAAAGIEGAGPYQGESYDAAALLALSVHAAGTTEGKAVAARMMEIANAPGERIGPGELARALEIVSAGGDIDYVGATDVEFSDLGEAQGRFRELEIESGEFRTRRLW